MSRPQVGIDRLPARRMTTEPKEAMNCKSCRKRKIKCNRLRPACEACQVFACPCIYDAVPKKRGPKTDVLEALLKRVDGLEKRLHSEGKSDSPDSEQAQDFTGVNGGVKEKVPSPLHSTATSQSQSQSSPHISASPDLLLDMYFARLHGKPHYILDEATARQRMQANQLPTYLVDAIYALSARYTPIFGGYEAAAQVGQEYMTRSRLEIDVDEPSIEAVQALLLLAQASYQCGKGKKAYMHLSSAISMALALNLHRELPLELKVPPPEREGRRRLFWSCYLLDRFGACGSKRPSLISDECIALRLPSWQGLPGSVPVEGEYFTNGLNLLYRGGHGKPNTGSAGMLIGITRILGITNRYLAAGGVKGDSHFPWHSSSTLSRIRQLLDVWASETQHAFVSMENVFGQPDSTTMVLSKLIYHLIHCLIYRPFLPVDLAELSGTTQHQSWQIEATNLCFLHANAITELVEIGKAASVLEWPAFVGYCICTAGTIHIHGAHYRGGENEVFSASGEFLNREMQQLSDLRYVWSGVQHQRDTLETVLACHAELVQSPASNPMRFSPGFHLDDFFDRYPGEFIDGSHLTFQEVVVDAPLEGECSTEPAGTGYFSQSTQNPSVAASTASFVPHPPLGSQSHPNEASQSRVKKRRATMPYHRKAVGSSSAVAESLTSGAVAPPTQGLNESHNTIKPEATISPEPPLIVESQATLGPLSYFSPIPSFRNLSSNFRSSPQMFAGEGAASLHQNPGLEDRASVGSMSSFEPFFTFTPPQQNATVHAPGPLQADADRAPDPVLSVLERISENGYSREGPSELDYFLENGNVSIMGR